MAESVEYNNLDFRINMLYDAVYNKNNTTSYVLTPIIKKNISLIDIKMSNAFDYMTNALTDEISYIGKYNSKWVFKRTSSSSYPCNLSIGTYTQGGNVNDLGRSELYNPTMHYILSELIISEKFKHIILPFMFFDVSQSILKTKLPDVYNVIKDDIDQSTKLYLFVTEHYFKMMTLNEYLEQEHTKMTLIDWKVLIFQVLYTLFKITDRLQKFRHNKLNLDAIRIYKKKEKKEENIVYKIGITNFYIPPVDFEIKLTDFDISNTTDYIRNKTSNEITDNPYYDLHYFISHLYIFIKKNNVSIPKELETFINDVIPEKFLPSIKGDFNGLNEREFDMISSQIIIPGILLKKNNFFKEFITELNTVTTSSIENEQINIDKLNIKESGIDYISPTDDNLGSRMLGRKNSYNNKKKSQQYYSNMIGSRKILVSKFDNNGLSTITTSQSADTTSSQYGGSVFSKAESKAQGSKRGSSKKHKKVNKKVNKKYKEDGIYDSHKYDNVDLSEVSNLTSTKINAGKNFINVLNRVGKNVSDNSDLKLEKHSGKNSEKSRTSNQSESSTQSESTKSTQSGSSRSSRSSRSSSKSKSTTESHTDKSSSEFTSESNKSNSINMKKINNNLSDLDKGFSSKLKNAPQNYFDEVPDHIKGKLPSLEMGMQGMQGMMNQGMMDPSMMNPGMMPQGMPGMMDPSMMNPSMMNPGMMNPSMMNPSMMNPGMMPQGMPGMMDPSMMNPGMMYQGMPNMMNHPGMPGMNDGGLSFDMPQAGGGGSKQPKKYEFIKNNNKKNENDFFF